MTDNVPPDTTVAGPEVVPSAGVAAPPAAVQLPSEVTVQKLEKDLADATDHFKTTHSLATLTESKKVELHKLKGTKRFFHEKVEAILDGEKDNDYYRIYGNKFARAIDKRIKHTENHYTKLLKKQKLDPAMEVLDSAVDECELVLSDWEGFFERHETPYDDESSEEDD